MDRRSLLAIVLSTLVILIFNLYFFPKPKPKAPVVPLADTLGVAVAGRTDDSTRGAAAPGDSLRPFPAVPGEPVLRQAPGASASTFPLRFDGVEARFTSRGGGLESWRLTAFKGPDGQPVEMVRGGVEPATRLHLDGRVIELDNTLYLADVEETAGGGQVVTFRSGEPGGLQVVKRYRLAPDAHLYDYDVEVTGLPESTVEAWLEIGWEGGLPVAERTAKTDHTAAGAIVYLGKDIQRSPAGGFKKEKSKPLGGVVHWVAARNKYFLAGIIPPEGSVTQAVVSGDAASHRAGATVRFPVTGIGEIRQSVRLYLGPLDYWKLKKVGYELERSVDLGWKILLPVSQALLWLLSAGYKLVPNYGVVIILLSALTRLLFYPMTKVSMQSMRAMQEIQPEMEKLRKKHKDDPNRLNQEVFALYKKHKINPVSGCLPLLLQMPVFFALYSVLSNSVELRQAPFVAWISDLSSPDTLFTVSGFNIHILPLLMAVTMFWQQAITPTDPRQAAMKYLMPVMMLFFLYTVPSGLTLYWTVVNILSVIQQYQMNREAAARSALATT